MQLESSVGRALQQFTEVMGLNLVQAQNFFQVLISQLLKLIASDDHSGLLEHKRIKNSKDKPQPYLPV